MRSKLLTGCILVATFVAATPVQAGALSKGLREALEYVGKKFGREVAEEGAERVSVRLTRLAARHGDEVVAKAFRKVGPRAGRLVEEAGEQEGVALGLLARHGEEAISLIGRPTALRTVARYGDDAAVAIIKHGTVGEQLVGQFAKKGAEALVKVTPRNGRRLAMMAAEGQLKPELMEVIARHGDRACDFIWRNKAALTVGATLTAFVTSPGPFIDGTQKLAATVADAAVKPIAVGVANSTNWTLLGVMVTVILAIAGYLRAVATGKISAWRGPSAKRTSDSNVPKE
jgi:hypothetical protein